MDAATVSRIRFATSPAHETYGWLTYAFSQQPHPIAGNLGTSARSALNHPDVRLLAQVVEGAIRTRYVPNFLLQPPLACDSDDDQVDALTTRWVRDEDRVREELEPLVPFQPAAWREDYRRRVARPDAARRLQSGFHRMWDELVRGEWPHMRALLRTDIARRGEAWLAGGVQRVVNELHPSLSWADGTLYVKDGYEDDLDVMGSTVTLIPTTTVQANVLVQVCVPEDRWISYPALSVEPARGPASGRELTELLGSTRAVVLDQLTAPRSTAELSETLGLAPATVSHHLHVLLRADLVTRRRSGHKILYTQSPKASRLLSSSDRELVWPQ